MRPLDDDLLPADVAAALAPLDSLSDADLWEVARTSRLSPAAAAHLAEENLWLACPVCNGFKGDRIEALDPLTGDVVVLFNPRQHLWREHFIWTEAGDHVIGRTSRGVAESGFHPRLG